MRAHIPTDGLNLPQHARWSRPLDVIVNTLLHTCGMRKIVPPPGYIAADLHVHSFFSKCCISSTEDILIRSAHAGLGAVAIADHNDLQSAEHAETCAQELKRRGLLPENFIVIPGMEVSSGSGKHIGALFVEGPIARGLGVAKTVEAIHNQDGLAVAVHPYIRSGLGDMIFEASFDAVEVESGAVYRMENVRRGYEIADDERLSHAARVGGSDAHFVGAVGLCATLIAADEITPDAVRAAILRGDCGPVATDACRRVRKILGKLPLSQQRCVDEDNRH